MRPRYRLIAWTPFKIAYDLALLLGLLMFLSTFVGIGLLAYPEITLETLLIRGLGLAALLLLHVTLSIGPLARLHPAFFPLLYNRRHLGVVTFLAALAHGIFSIFQFHASGNANPLISLLTSNPRWDSLGHFPFQLLGLGALLILFAMAATSHDFWLEKLSPPRWKLLHMLVYPAYLLVVLHVALGTLRVESSPVYPSLLVLGAVWVVGLHLAAGWCEWRRDREQTRVEQGGYVDFCGVEEVQERRARVLAIAGQPVAVFRHQGRFFAVSGICPHQNGPLGEGAVVNGYITCPWHGHQFHPQSGCAPPPYTDCVQTFPLRIREQRIWVGVRANPPGEGLSPGSDGRPDPGEVQLSERRNHE